MTSPHNLWRRTWGIALAALAFSCAGTTAITVAGETVLGVADGYYAAKLVYFNACFPGSPTYAEKHFPVEQCQDWANQTKGIDEDLKLAADLWDAAAEANDPAKRGQAEAIVFGFLPRLLPLAQQVGIVIKTYTGGRP